MCGVHSSCTQNHFPYCQCLTGFEPTSPNEWDLKDYSSGCSRKTNLTCAEDGFLSRTSVSVPANKKHSYGARSSKECESNCLENCSCTAYTYDEIDGCSVWTGDLLNLQQLVAGDGNGKTLHLRLASSEIPNAHNKFKGSMTAIGTGVALGIGIIVVGVLFFGFREKKQKYMKEEERV